MIVTQIINLYNFGEQKSNSACTTHQTIKWMSYNSRTHWVPLLSAKTWLQGKQADKNWIAEDWKKTRQLSSLRPYAISFLVVDVKIWW